MSLGSILKTGHFCSMTSLFKNDQRPKLHGWILLWGKFEKNAFSLLFSALCRKSTRVYLENWASKLFKNNQCCKLLRLILLWSKFEQIAFLVLFSALCRKSAKPLDILIQKLSARAENRSINAFFSNFFQSIIHACNNERISAGCNYTTLCTVAVIFLSS